MTTFHEETKVYKAFWPKSSLVVQSSYFLRGFRLAHLQLLPQEDPESCVFAILHLKKKKIMQRLKSFMQSSAFRAKFNLLPLGDSKRTKSKPIIYFPCERK